MIEPKSQPSIYKDQHDHVIYPDLEADTVVDCHVVPPATILFEDIIEHICSVFLKGGSLPSIDVNKFLTTVWLAAFVKSFVHTSRSRAV